MSMNSIRCQFNPRCENSPMPGIARSDVKSSNFLNKAGKMPAPNLLRLNSVGEVSPECFPQPKVAGKGKIGFSKSLDSISPSKRLSAGMLTADSNPFHSIMRTASLIEQPGWLKGGNHCHSTISTHSSSNPGKFWPPALCPLDKRMMFPNHNRENLSTKPQIVNGPFFQAPEVNQNHPYRSDPRFSGLMPGAMLAAVTVSPFGAVKKPQNQSPVKERSFQQFLPSGYTNSCSVHKVNSQSHPADSTMGFEKKEVATESNVMRENVRDACIDNLESHVDKLDINDPHKLVQENKEFDELSKGSDDQYSTNGKSCHRASGLKRRNEMCNSQVSDSNCPLANVLNDLSSVLFLRKTPKKGRPSCKKRKKKQFQRTSINSEPVEGHSSSSVDIKPVSSQSHISPSQLPGAVKNLSAVPFHSPVRPIVSSPPKPRPSCVAKLFCSPNSDSESSDAEDFDDCDSSKLPRDFSNSLSPCHELGPSLSLDSIFKSKGLSQHKTPLNDSLTSPVLSPGSSSNKSFHFSFSFSVSEEDDSERSFESVAASPSEQLFLDLGFGNGLCVEAFIGKAAESGSSLQCNSKEESPSKQDALLLKINAEWDKNYPAIPYNDDIGSTLACNGKVQFANGRDLEQIHFVGNEERRGTWFEDGQRFQKRIGDVGKVLAPIFTDSHRQKMRFKLGLD